MLTVNERNALRNGLELYNKYSEKQIAEAFGGYHDWSAFENEHAGLTCGKLTGTCLLYTSPSPRDRQKSRMPSSA